LTLSHTSSIPCIGAVETLIYLSCLFLGGSENTLFFLKYVLVCTGTYCLVQMWNSCTDMFCHVLACTYTYWYIPFCQILSRCTGFLMLGRCPAGFGKFKLLRMYMPLHGTYIANYTHICTCYICTCVNKYVQVCTSLNLYIPVYSTSAMYTHVHDHILLVKVI
jgi:hypothetical protein